VQIYVVVIISAESGLKKNRDSGKPLCPESLFGYESHLQRAVLLETTPVSF
jgi:hypothetical protein